MLYRGSIASEMC